MNTKLLLIAISVAAFSSCTTLYKAGQTPDDVYFSPARSYGSGEEKQREEPKDEVQKYNNTEDRMIRIGINDRRFRYLDISSGYSPYDYGYNSYGNGFGSLNYGYDAYNYGSYNYGSYNYGYNPYNNGHYYNPYFVSSPVYLIPYSPKTSTPRMVNLGGYNPVYNNTNPKSSNGVRPVRSYNNNNGSAVGKAIRQIFTPANTNTNNTNSTNNNNNNNSSNNTRTYTPAASSSSSSSSGSSSSGSGSVSRPPRSGGN